VTNASQGSTSGDRPHGYRHGPGRPGWFRCGGGARQERLALRPYCGPRRPGLYGGGRLVPDQELSTSPSLKCLLRRGSEGACERGRVPGAEHCRPCHEDGVDRRQDDEHRRDDRGRLSETWSECEARSARPLTSRLPRRLRPGRPGIPTCQPEEPSTRDGENSARGRCLRGALNPCSARD